MKHTEVTINAIAGWAASLLVAGLGLSLLMLGLNTSQVLEAAAQEPAELCVTPNPMVHYIVLPDLIKGVGGISSRYVITSQGAGHATTAHSFCASEHDLVIEQPDAALIEAYDSRIYELAKITGLPWGYQGYVVAQSGFPITGTVLPPQSTVFLPVVLRAQPPPDVRITYINYPNHRPGSSNTQVELQY